jgi:RNA polymerase sigma factor (sigma-70 family)
VSNSSPGTWEHRDDLVELVRRAQAGSNAAAETLFRRYKEPLLLVVRRVINPDIRRLYDSEDFLLSTFTEVFTRHFSDEVLKSPQTLWAYLKKIAQNKVHDAQRKYLVAAGRNLARQVPLEDLTADDLLSTELSPESMLMLKELVEDRLEDLIRQLPELLQIIIRRLLDGHSAAAIAHDMGLEQKRVYRAIYWLKGKICGA